jgi:transposase
MEGFMLIGQGLQKQVWVFMQSIDMRKSYDGLYGLIKSFHSNPLSGDLFLFLSKDRKKAKAMYWDGTGLVILMKRIERGCFANVLSRGTMSLSEVALFFEGAGCVRQRLSPPDQTQRYLP